MHLLVNWLVHGTALTLLVALGVGACRRVSAATRERLWQTTAIGVGLMPVFYLGADRAASHVRFVALALPDPPVTVHASWTHWAALILAGWAVWTALSLVRLAVGLLRLHRARRSASPFPPEREARLPIWTTLRARGRPATLVVSPRVHRAGVLGLGRPLIAIAPATLARLTDEELDQVVLHEYAHIQRRDDLSILAQRMLAALAGLHPAVRWLDRAMTLDREVACDDWIVAYTGAGTRYAACLVALAAPGPTPRRSLVPGAVWSRSQLSVRVSALLDTRRVVAIAPSRATCLLAMPAVLALVAAFAVMPLAGVAVDPLPEIPVPARLVAATVLGPVDAPGAPADSSLHAATARSRELIAEPRVASALHAPTAPAAIRETSAAPTRDEPIEEARSVFGELPASAIAPVSFAVEPAGGRREIEATGEPDRPWRAAVAAGLAIGSSSRSAARRTAAAFTRVGRSFANPF